MGSITHNLRLNVPDFDQNPWDVDVNTNWLVLDATVGMFAAIPNLVGAWKNSTLYTYGQSVIDSTDSTIWQCIQTHTSSDPPELFLNERIAYPGRWTMTTQGAQFYATQAAASAASAQAAADAAAASAAVTANALQLTGGTMTGYIVLHADPVAIMQPATKQYVDSRIAGVGYLPLTGGTLTGPLYAGGTGIGYMNITPADRALISFGWDGAALYGAVNGVSIGTLATRAYAAGAFLPLTGGSLSGSLYAAGEIQAQATLRILNSSAYFHSNASNTIIQMDSGGWNLTYNRSTGSLTYYRGGDGLNLWYIDGAGNSFVRGGIQINGTTVSNGNIHARSGLIYYGAGDRARIHSDNSAVTSMSFLDNYQWHFSWASGVISWLRYDGIATFNLNNAGTANFMGDVNAGNNIRSTNVLSCISGSMWFGTGGNGRIMQIANGWYWEWDGSNGNLYWQTASGIHLAIRADNAQIGNERGPMGGYGGYLNYSDERGKTDILPSEYGLSDIVRLEPIVFKRVKAAHDREEVGFSAQQVQKVIPHAVWELDPEDHKLGVCLDPIVVALVNATKEMAQRLQQLEDRNGTATH